MRIAKYSETKPTPYKNIDEIKTENRRYGGHWFDKNTLTYFSSRILPTIYGGRIFISSEKDKHSNEPRKYTLREAMPDGSIHTIGEFGDYETLAAAKQAAKRAAQSLHDYEITIDGDTNPTTISASTPWEAIGKLPEGSVLRWIHRARM